MVSSHMKSELLRSIATFKAPGLHAYMRTELPRFMANYEGSSFACIHEERAYKILSWQKLLAEDLRLQDSVNSMVQVIPFTYVALFGTKNGSPTCVVLAFPKSTVNTGEPCLL